jgi:CHAT domain-containing protein
MFGWMLSLVLGTFVIGWAACGRSPANSSSLSEIAALLGPRRTVEPRLTGGFRHARCAPPDGRSSLVPEARCSTLPPEVIARVRKMLLVNRPITRGGDGTDLTRTDLHTLGVTYLVADRSDSAVGRAVASLQRAAEKAPGDAALQSDLAAAYLVSAQRRGEPYDLIRALAAAEKALEIAPGLSEARFNRALILEKLFLATEAKLAWQRYLEVDSGSDWSREAAVRAKALDRKPWDDEWKEQRARLDEAGVRGDPGLVESLIDGFHQPSREYAQEELLPQWADAMATGRDDEAVRLLRIARALGDALARRTSDPMIRDTVAAIDAADGKRRAALVDGLRTYRDARRLYMDMHFGDAEPRFSQASGSLRRGNSPLAGWAELFAAVCVHFQADYPLAGQLLDELNDRTDVQAYPALRGRILYNLGITRSSQGDLAGGLAAYRQALPLYERTGETENLAAVRHVVAENLDMLGQPAESWKYRYLALSMLDHIPNAVRRSSLLMEATEACLKQNHPFLALLFQNELIRNVGAWGGKVSLPDALLQRSRTQMRLGRREAARHDLDEAERQSEEIEDHDIAQRMQADILVARGQLLEQTDPMAAEADFGQSINFYRQVGFRLPLARTHLARARVRSRLDNLTAVEEDLRAGIEEYENQRASLSGDSQRSSYFEQSRALFDEMILLQIRQGRTDLALDYAERSRSRALLDQIAALPKNVSPLLVTGEGPLSFRRILQALPATTAVIEYAFIGRKLFVWVIGSGEIHGTERDVDPSHLAVSIERLRVELRQPSRVATASGRTAELYDVLLRPLAPWIQGKKRLIFIPDGLLYSLPFAALVDRTTSHFLIQDYELAVAPSATIYVHCLERDRHFGTPSYTSILAVGNPAAPQDLFPEAVPLAEAEAEASQVAEMYPRPELLTGTAATSQQFLRLAGASDVVHFAGHAHVNESYPLLSALLLSPEPGREGSGPLFAYQIYGRSFESTRLVVLAACSTARGGATVHEGPIGLARPFLTAGVPAVVASLAEVDDGVTLRLVTSFHRHLRRGEDPLAALRAAQREMIEHPDPMSRAPWSWAAFEVIGGAGQSPQGQ